MEENQQIYKCIFNQGHYQQRPHGVSVIRALALEQKRSLVQAKVETDSVSSFDSSDLKEVMVKNAPFCPYLKSPECK